MRMLVVGAVLTLAGLVILLIGLQEATGDQAADLAISTRGLATIFVGAVFFAVGGMLALVAIVRPLFEKRPIDRGTD